MKLSLLSNKMKFKKPKFWDLNKPNLISYLLMIFTIPIIINNFFLNLKTKKKNRVKLICVGNIYVGGTGKTTTTIKLNEILKEMKFNVAVGKKYYRDQLDEQILLKNRTNVILDRNRNNIIEKAIEFNYDLLIFDDGLQDKNISYDLELVCFDNENWIGNGQLLPSGPLREKLYSLKKYDAVFIKNNSKYSNFNIEMLKKINPEIKVFNTKYRLSNLQSFETTKKYLIFSGIGNPKDFKNILLENNLNIIEEIIYPDHYEYKKKDIELIKKRAEEIDAEIITTEKDYVKIPKDDNKNINYLEINLEIIEQNELINFIKKKINE